MPLLLDDDEAVAVTLGLQNNATGTVTGIEEASLRALTKVEQVLPTRLRHPVDALRGAVVAMPPRYDPGSSVDAGSLPWASPCGRTAASSVSMSRPRTSPAVSRASSPRRFTRAASQG
jgi:hypothetical protein